MYIFLDTGLFVLTAARKLYYNSFSNCLCGILVTVANSHRSRIVQRVYFVTCFSRNIVHTQLAGNRDLSNIF